VLKRGHDAVFAVEGVPYMRERFNRRNIIDELAPRDSCGEASSVTAEMGITLSAGAGLGGQEAAELREISKESCCVRSFYFRGLVHCD
jgi:hypothetical protein